MNNDMDEKMKQFIRLMEDTDMNKDTIYWAIYLVRDKDLLDYLIKYIIKCKTYITDHQLRQEIAEQLVMRNTPDE